MGFRESWIFTGLIKIPHTKYLRLSSSIHSMKPPGRNPETQWVTKPIHKHREVWAHATKLQELERDRELHTLLVTLTVPCSSEKAQYFQAPPSLLT